jgi:hypothetical protein
MVLALTACASKSAGPAGPPATAASPPAAPAAAAPVADPKEVVRAFFAAIAQLDVARAAEFASFPFDVDGYDGCVQSKKELVDLIATYKPPPPGTPIEIGDVGLIPLDGSAMKPPSWPEDHWRSHLKHFTAADAKCLGPADAAQIYSYYFVEFTVGGEAVGAIIRLRCRGASCGVAGTDK